MVISASAQPEFMLVIFTFTWSPSLTLPMKTMKPLTVAMPSPFGLIWLMSASYSLPTVTGQYPLPRLFLAFLGGLFLGLIGQFSPTLLHELTVCY